MIWRKWFTVDFICYSIFTILSGLVFNAPAPVWAATPPKDEVAQAAETPTEIPTQTIEDMGEFTIIPVGLNVGKRNMVPSALVRGLEDGTQAIDFRNWLIPFEDVVKALQLQINPVREGLLEVRAPGLLTRINPEELRTDPELGLVISVEQVEILLKVPAEFDLKEYAIQFNPPWLDFRGRPLAAGEIPVITEGLPQVFADRFTLTAIGQEANATGRRSVSRQDSNEYRGELSAVGTLLGGSWFIRTNQSDLTDNSTWNLQEAQFWHQTDSADYVIGSQPTFWRSEGSVDYWGITTIQRWGFKPEKTGDGGFNPSQRLQTNQVGRSIAGEAAPGTLVQLVGGIGDRLISEVLVDSSGVYRFDDVPAKGQSYRVFLYPDGLLTAEPEIEEARFSTLPTQLPDGASALTISGGWRRQFSQTNNFLGEFPEVRGGISYRRGISEDLTLGLGVVYDRQSARALGELFYQPGQIPLQVSVLAFNTREESPWELESEIRFNPSPQFNLSFRSDRLAQRFNLNWGIFPGFSFIANGDSSDSSLATGVQISGRSLFGSTFARIEFDTEKELLWSLRQELGNLRFDYRGDDINTEAEVSYNLSGKSSFNEGHSLVLSYDTRNLNDSNDNLAALSWRYRSAEKLLDSGLPLWEFDLGYGIGSRGSGFVASAATAVIPGLTLRLRYEQVSLSSDDASFRIDLFPILNLQRGIRPGPTSRNFDRLRNEGGLWIQPFFDHNNNGLRDGGEEIFTEGANLLLIINNRPLKFSRPEIRGSGVFVTLPPDTYRLDLDPAGFPFDWKPSVLALAVEVAPGSYTRVLLPFTLSYTFSGIVTDGGGKPVNGARVEAVPTDGGPSVFSITNSAGVFYLEGLEQGSYTLQINGQPAQPEKLEIDESSEPFQELNLKKL
jgi:hypothetical protein